MHRAVRPAALAAATAMIALFLPTTQAAADIVYDSISPVNQGFWFIHDSNETSSSVEIPGGFENESQAGELIVLAGDARLVTDIQFRIRGPANFTAPIGVNVTMRLWEANNGTPGAMLWSGVQPVTFPTGSNAFVDAFFSPGITVPDTLIWTFAFDDIVTVPVSNTFFGAGLHSQPVAIGTNPGGVISQDTTTMQWQEDPIESRNLEARFTAIPAPGAGLLVTALAVALRRRR